MKDSGNCEIFIFGAKTIGPSHTKKGLPCQDAWASELLTEDSAVIAVSDGLGSAKKSETGAYIAVKAAVESIKNHYSIIYEDGSTSADLTKDETLIKEAFFSATGEIEKYSQSNNIPKKDLACTLIVVFISRNTVSIGQVGDGAVAGEYLNGDIAVLSRPAESEYINEVTPITAEKWISKLSINASLTNVRNIAAFTDGCQRAILIKENGNYIPFIPFFNPLFKYSGSIEDISVASEDVKQLLLSEKMTKVSDDDKTLVIATIKKGKKRITDA